jgi:predicted branched-subunit amino acid permease
VGRQLLELAVLAVAEHAGHLPGRGAAGALGLEFAGTLALLAVTCSLITSRVRALSALLAGGAAVLAMGLPYRLGIVVAIVVAVVASVGLERWLEAAPNPEQGHG